jgi:hypothetical protein
LYFFFKRFAACAGKQVPHKQVLLTYESADKGRVSDEQIAKLSSETRVSAKKISAWIAEVKEADLLMVFLLTVTHIAIVVIVFICSVFCLFAPTARSFQVDRDVLAFDFSDLPLRVPVLERVGQELDVEPAGAVGEPPVPVHRPARAHAVPHGDCSVRILVVASFQQLNFWFDFVLFLNCAGT